MRTCSAQPVPCYGKYYVYSSSPALSHADRQRKPKPIQKKSGTCFPNHAANIRTRGAHEFYNMMWDPSVYRGNTTKPYYIPETERCKRQRDMESSVKRRKFPRKQKLIGGIVRPSLSLADQTDKLGFGDMGLQTEEFLQEITANVTRKDMCTQIEAETNARKEEGECILRPFMIGTCQTSQTDPSFSYSFEENVGPLQKELSNKIMEQSLLETTEEMEIEALRKEKRKYIQIRGEELYKLKRAIDAQRAVAEERIRAMDDREAEAKLESEAESRLGAALFSAGCMGGVLPITFGVMKLEGFLPRSGSNDVYENLIPWMNEEVKKSYAGRKIVSRKLLDEMLCNITTEREAEFASNQFWNSLGSDKKPHSQNFSLTEDDQHSMSLGSTGKLGGKSMMFYAQFGEEE